MIKVYYIFFVLILLAACSENDSPGLRQIENTISLKDFFRNPDRSDVKISSDGKFISYLAPYKTRMNIFVRKIGSDSVIMITSETERDISMFLWAGKDRILFLKDNKGDENYKLYSAKSDGSGIKSLIDLDNVNAKFIDKKLYNGDEMIISLNKRNPAIYDIYRINVETGKLRLIFQNPGNIQKFIADHEGSVRLAFGADGANSALYFRDNESQQFRKIMTVNSNDIFLPLMFSPDNNKIIASSNIGRDKQAIVEIDPKTGTELKVLYQNPDYDVPYLIFSPKSKTILGYQYTSWKKEYHITDKYFMDILSKLNKALGEYEISIADFDENEEKYIIRTYSDRSLGAYYLFDKSNGRIDLVCEISPWLDENQLSPMMQVEYISRDSNIIHGYLTVPKGRESRNLPVVVKIHGGPWARDTWGFDPESQFLANRGFAVFQMNYRGSIGYGKKFWQSSFRQWGLSMADDVTDGVNWLINQGIADKKRIAVYGYSYGGYQALVQLVKNPDLYRCGISYVGLTNLFTFMKSMPPSWTVVREKLYKMIGNPANDSLQFFETSPVFHADRIKVPVFIAQGANDIRVKMSEAEQMVVALRKNGINVEYMLKTDEGHGFVKEENRLEFYKKMEEFLGKYLSK
jgi:dipeptidyl aminopeptidase/acylaminoacyl peptidase